MSVIIDALRYISSLIDWGLYSLAGFIYQVFCAIATSTIIEADDVRAFAERIYVVVGVFMLFKVGISMLKYLINPDQLTDSKAGYSKLLWNISCALILLVSIPTIYDYAMKVQTAILKSNVIAKVVLGKTAGATADFKDAGKSMIYTTLSAFVMPNYSVTDKDGNYVILESSADVRACFNTKEDGSVNTGSGYDGMFKMKDGAITGLNSKCDSAFSDMTDDESKDMYISATKNSDIQQLLDVTVDAKLNDEIQEDAGRGGTLAVKLYFLKYMWGISWLIGAFLCFIFATFCIDMGIRSIKLAFLILISPIPVLSMVNPDKGANGMLSEWWKMTLATYLDLFLRIMSIFFVIFVIQQVDLTGTIAEEFGPIVSAFAMVFIIIGALLFAKELPELISKLIPGMGTIMKGGFNPLKKLGEAANIASRAPLVGKGLTNLSNRFATQHAMNRANRRMANFQQSERNKAIKSAYKKQEEDIKNSNKTEAEKAKELEKLDQARKAELAASKNMKKDEIKGGRADAKIVAKEAGAAAAASVGIFGGEAKAVTSAGAAAAKIKKENMDKINKMKASSRQRADDAATFDKANGTVNGKTTATYDAAYNASMEKSMQAINTAQKELQEKGTVTVDGKQYTGAEAAKQISKMQETAKADATKQATEAAKQEYFGTEHYEKMKTADTAKAAMYDAQKKFDTAHAEHSRNGTVTTTNEKGETVTLTGAEADAEIAKLAKDVKQKTSDHDKAKTELKSYEEVHTSAGEKRAAYEREDDRRKIAATYSSNSTATQTTTAGTSQSSSQTTTAAEPTTVELNPGEHIVATTGDKTYVAKDLDGTNVIDISSLHSIENQASSSIAQQEQTIVSQPNSQTSSQVVSRSETISGQQTNNQTSSQVVSRSETISGQQTNNQTITRDVKNSTQQDVSTGTIVDGQVANDVKVETGDIVSSTREDIVGSIETKVANNQMLTRAEEAINKSSTVMVDIVNQSKVMKNYQTTISSRTQEISQMEQDYERIKYTSPSEAESLQREIERARADLKVQQQGYGQSLQANEATITRMGNTINELKTEVRTLQSEGKNAEAQVLQEEINKLITVYNQATDNNNNQ